MAKTIIKKSIMRQTGASKQTIVFRNDTGTRYRVSSIKQGIKRV